ncbi:MAG: LacI family DNA-binding transcriptional regulator [bacterium]
MGISITLRDIALAAGVSPIAVSKAITGRPAGVRISAGTRARILAIVRQSGYKPNRPARDMVLGRQSTIALVLAAGSPAASAALIQEVEPVLSAAGYRLVVAVLPVDPAATRERVTTVLHDNLAGILCCPVAMAATSQIVAGSCPVIPLASGSAASMLKALGVPVPVLASVPVAPPVVARPAAVPRPEKVDRDLRARLADQVPEAPVPAAIPEIRNNPVTQSVAIPELVTAEPVAQPAAPVTGQPAEPVPEPEPVVVSEPVIPVVVDPVIAAEPPIEPEPASELPTEPESPPGVIEPAPVEESVPVISEPTQPEPAPVITEKPPEAPVPEPVVAPEPVVVPEPVRPVEPKPAPAVVPEPPIEAKSEPVPAPVAPEPQPIIPDSIQPVPVPEVPESPAEESAQEPVITEDQEPPADPEKNDPLEPVVITPTT